MRTNAPQTIRANADVRGPAPCFLHRAILIILALSAATAFASAAALRAASRQGSLTVSAAVSLKDALDAITPLFSKQHPDVTVRYNLGASGTLEQQIEHGAPVDVFISASPDQMEALAKQHLLLEGSRQDFARNTVVLIVPATSSQVSNFKDILKPSVKFVAIGEPDTVPAGNYARQVLTHYALYDSLRPKIVFAKDVRQVLTYVATGNADAGIVYATDAIITKQVKVVAIAPENSHAPVVYQIAVVGNSSSAYTANVLVNFLCSAPAQTVLQRFGFSPSR